MHLIFFCVGPGVVVDYTDDMFPDLNMEQLDQLGDLFEEEDFISS